MKKTTVCTRQTVAVKNRKWECLIIRKRILILANGVPVISTFWKIVFSAWDKLIRRQQEPTWIKQFVFCSVKRIECCTSLYWTRLYICILLSINKEELFHYKMCRYRCSDWMHYDGNQLRPRYDNFSIGMIKTRETSFLYLSYLWKYFG